jgi:hypothetical protein
MRLKKLPFNRHLCCFVLVGITGLLPFFKGAEDPEAVMQRFVALFKAQDAQAILNLISPEVVTQTELTVKDVEGFIKRFRSDTLTLERIQIDKRLKSEDGEVERFQTTLLFRGPVFGPEYKNPALLSMKLLWLLEGGKWWLERPLTIHYVVTANDPYPTPDQQERAMRLQASLEVLGKLGLPGSEDLNLLPSLSSGAGVDGYKELEKLYSQERGPKGVASDGRGVQVFLEAAAHKQGGFLSLYQADFENDAGRGRRPAPWDMYRDYVSATLKYAKSLEKRKKYKTAESVYRKCIAFGRQLLDEPGGFQFVLWGITFQKQGAEELARLLAETGSPQSDQAEAFTKLAARRLDLLQTALSCLDDMTDYRSLQAAVIAGEPSPVNVFRSWGVNTLTILALKGAPAARETIRNAGAMVVVDNPAMRQVAWKALEKLAAEPSGKMAAFIEKQKKWVGEHEVYGTVQSFR